MSAALLPRFCRASAAPRLLMLALGTAFLLAPSSARAGHWVASYQCSFDGTPSSNHAAPNYTGPATAHTVVVTATLTWTHDNAQDTSSPAATFSYIEKSNAGIHVASNGGNPQGLINEKDDAQDGLGDAPVEDGPRPPYYGAGSAGSLLGQKPGAATVTLDTRTLKVSLSYDTGSAGANGGYGLSYSVAVTTLNLTINLTGTTKDSGGTDNILVGQRCSAGVTATGGTISTPYKWEVSGTTFQSWNGNDGTLPVAAVKGPGILTNSTANWCWNDLVRTPETVKCTANATPTGQSAMQVTVSKPVIVQVPTSTATGIGGYMQVNGNCMNLKGAIALYAGPLSGHRGGMDFHLTVDTPTTPAFGPGMLELVQIASPNDGYVTTAKTNPPSQHHTDPLNGHTGVDGGCPYDGVQTSETNSLDPDDSPNLPLLNTTFSASVTPSFTDYLMYLPPSKGNGVQWVALSAFHWNANGSAQIPTKTNPDGDWANFKTDHNGSDAAGTVSYSNTPTLFTPISMPNTFPEWTEVITAKAY